MVYIRPENEKHLAELDVKTEQKTKIATVVLTIIIITVAAVLVGTATAVINALLSQ